MFEQGGVLRTWSLSRPPLPPICMEAELLADHRLAYLEYEGEVSGGRGRVVRWDWGIYVLLGDGEDVFEAEVCGQYCRGRLVLARRAAQRWSLRLLNEPLKTTGSRGSPT